eukprot:156037_1
MSCAHALRNICSESTVGVLTVCVWFVCITSARSIHDTEVVQCRLHCHGSKDVLYVSNDTSLIHLQFLVPANPDTNARTGNPSEHRAHSHHNMQSIRLCCMVRPQH